MGETRSEAEGKIKAWCQVMIKLRIGMMIFGAKSNAHWAIERVTG
jgi:hypothetical protein